MNVTQYNDGIIKYRNRYIKLRHLHSFEIKTLGLQNMTKLPRTSRHDQDVITYYARQVTKE